MTASEALSLAIDRLTASGLPTPRDDASCLLRLATAWSRADILAHPEKPLSANQEKTLLELVTERRRHFPIQYLRGDQEFYGRLFKVNEDVLIPRPETELLVDVALQELRRQESRRVVVDIGTGSGCLAITLLCEDEELRAIATDLSHAALSVAKWNACALGCLDRLEILQGNLLEPVPIQAYSILIANLPYGGRCASASVDKSVRRWEPDDAVFAGPTGLEVISQLLSEAPPFLNARGRLILEIGAGQMPEVRSLAEAAGWRVASVRTDLAGIDRSVVLALQQQSSTTDC